MYFTSDAGGSGFHIWRMRYPDGPAQAITSGPTEEEGIAMAPDGKSLIGSVGRAQGTVWFHDNQGDRQLSSEGYALSPELSPDGTVLYYLQASRGSTHSPPSRNTRTEETELVRVELRTGASEQILSGASISHFKCPPMVSGDLRRQGHEQSLSHLAASPAPFFQDLSAPATAQSIAGHRPRFRAGRDAVAINSHWCLNNCNPCNKQHYLPRESFL